MTLMNRQTKKQIDDLREELEQARYQNSTLQNNEAIIEVYKKKLDNMGEMKQDLVDAQDINQKLQ